MHAMAFIYIHLPCLVSQAAWYARFRATAAGRPPVTLALQFL
jgi:hypothetical protein